MINEIQLTGDIFFPGRWLNVTLSGHQSQEAYEIVSSFMNSESAQDVNEKLKLKIWVSADMLHRSVEMKSSKLSL